MDDSRLNSTPKPHECVAFRSSIPLARYVPGIKLDGKPDSFDRAAGEVARLRAWLQVMHDSLIFSEPLSSSQRDALFAATHDALAGYDLSEADPPCISVSRSVTVLPGF